MRLLTTLALSCFVLAGNLAAATLAETKVCLSEGRVEADERLAACSALILSGYRQPNVYMHRGDAYLMLGDNDRAIADFTTALSLDPDYADALIGRGLALTRKGQFDKAIDDYDDAIEARPSARAYLLRGHAHLKTRWPNYRQAIADLTASLELKPDSAAALNNRCWARALWQRELELALADCDLALALKPDYAVARDSRGFVHFRLARYGEAIADFDAALARTPEAAHTLYMRGVAKLRLNDKSGHADIARALRLNAEVARVYAVYGVRR